MKCECKGEQRWTGTFEIQQKGESYFYFYLIFFTVLMSIE